MYWFLFYVTLFSGFIPLSYLLITKGSFIKMKDPLVIYLALVFMASFYELVFTKGLGVNVTYWFQFYSLLELFCVYYIFSKINNKFKVFNLIACGVMLLTYVFSFKYWNTQNGFTATSINRFPITIYVMVSFLLWMRTLFTQIRVNNLWDYSEFYFIAGIVIYYFSTAFLFLMSNFLFQKPEFFLQFWVFNIIATLILRLLLLLSAWKMK